MKTEIENEYAKMQEEKRTARIARYKKKIAFIIWKWKWRVPPDKFMLFHEDSATALRKIRNERNKLEKLHDMKEKTEGYKTQKRKKTSVLVLWICCPLLIVTIGRIHSIDPTHPLLKWLAVLFVLICIYFGNKGRVEGTTIKRPKQLRLLDDIKRVHELKKSIAEAERTFV